MTTVERLEKDKKYRENIASRAKITQAIRDFFVSRGFEEMFTPSLSAHPGMEPYLDPLEVRVASDKGQIQEAGLITSPEYSLKKILSAGFDKVFEIAKVYRNRETFEGLHNAEFFMLEWYRRNTDYKDIMDDTDDLLAAVSKNKFGKAERIRVRDIFLERTGIDLDAVLDAAALIEQGRNNGFEMKDKESFDDAFFRIFLTAVEPGLKDYKHPVILYEYPIELASLAKAAKNPRYAERFEMYINGIEIANAFSELTDASEQRKRFEEEAQLRQTLRKRVFSLDEELLSNLGKIGRAGGIALGVDRLIMALLDAPKLEDVMLFPSSELFDNLSDKKQVTRDKR